MLFSRYKEKEDIIKIIAKQEGISVAEIRKEMELAVENAYKADNPEIKKEFKKMFGNKKPTPEEFIYKMSKKLIKEK